MTTKITLLGDRVLIRRDTSDAVSKGGIIIPEEHRKVSDSGEIVAIGTGPMGKDGKRVPMTLEVGDRVMIDKYGGVEYRIGDELLVVFQAKDVLGLLP